MHWLVHFTAGFILSQKQFQLLSYIYAEKLCCSVVQLFSLPTYIYFFCSPLGPCSQHTVQLQRSGKLQQAKTVQTSDTVAYFDFVDVLPGDYTSEIKDSSFCWESRNLKVKIDNQRDYQLEFKQTGFLVEILITHDADLASF